MLSSFESVTHVIQVALTPVFLLSGIAALLNVFSARLGRVADRVDELTLRLEANHSHRMLSHWQAQLAYLRRRSRLLDAAVVLGGCGGILTCAAAAVLFIGALRESASIHLLLGIFATSLVSTVGALGCFIVELVMAGRGLRAEAAQPVKAALEPPAVTSR